MTGLEQDHKRRDMIRTIQSEFENYMINCVTRSGRRSSLVVMKILECAIDALFDAFGPWRAKAMLHEILAARELRELSYNQIEQALLAARSQDSGQHRD